MSGTEARGLDERAATRNVLWLTAGYGAVLLLFAALLLEREPYDDSYFFKRLALNLLDRGSWAWNVSDGPVYGATSQLFQLLMLGLTAITRTHTFLLARLVLICCLVGCFALLLRTTYAQDRGLATVLTGCSPVVLYTALSGMETALVMLLLALLGWLLATESERASHWSVAPLLVVCVWLARPDAVLLAGPWLLVERLARGRRVPWREAVLMGALGLGALAAFKLYYGTALPLPFYAKQGAFSPYDAHFRAVSAASQRQRFGMFLFVAAPLLLVALRRRDRTNLLLLGLVGLFVTYHLAATIDVMGMHGRFYAPTLPLLVIAAARGTVDLAPVRASVLLAIAYAVIAVALALFLLPKRGRLDRAPAGYFVWSAALALVLLAALARRHLFSSGAAAGLAGAGLVVVLSHPRVPLELRSDETYLALHASHVTVYRGLETLRSCFGDAIHVYHADVGVPGLRFARGKVTDLAGLLSPEWVFRTTSFDAACTRDRPEGIFLPHKNYIALNEEIRRSECIGGYRRVVAESSGPLFVREDLAERYAACARAGGE